MSKELQITVNIKEQIEEVKRVLTPEFHNKMMKYGIFRLISVFKIKYDVERGFRGVMIEDVILETFESFTREGGRIWNKTKFEKFEKQIFSAFDSCLQNTVRKEFDEAKDIEPLPENDNLEEVKSSSKYNEMLKISIETLNSLGATELEKNIFEPYYIHRMKREDVAEYLGIGVNEITKAGKRLDNKLPLLRDKLNKIKNDE